MESIAYTLKEDGFIIFGNIISKTEISSIQNERDNLLGYYSLNNVKERLFYKREESHNRVGDAFMGAFEIGDLPTIKIQKDSSIGIYMKLYQDIVSSIVGKKFKDTYRCMINTQEYFSESLPVWDHYDMEAFDFEHCTNDSAAEIDGKSLKLKSALIPRYVMVMVLTNENDGQGVYIREHNSDERINVTLNAGDIIIFDNQRFRHGVPALNKPRSMLGFRSMDYEPIHFEEHPDGGNNWIEIQDKINPGWGMEISSEEAKEIMINFNKKWKAELYDIFIKKPAAF